jgi:hypothetical protein
MIKSDKSADGVTPTVTVGDVALGCCAAADVAHSTALIISDITVRMIKSSLQLVSILIAICLRGNSFSNRGSRCLAEEKIVGRNQYKALK